MNCPEHLVLEAFDGNLLIWMYWLDVPKETIPLHIWLNPLRYEIIFKYGNGTKRVVINKEGRWANAHGNFMVTYVRPHLCRLLGIHQRPKFKGGERLCYHCNVGRGDDV